MASELVSIIMPAKNAAPYLAACLESILAQTYTNYELIVINDHSKDNTLEILHNYTHRFTRFLVLNNKGLGIISALQLGFKHATGKYITRMDADDKMAPKKLELLQKACQKSKQIVATGLVEYFADGGIGEGYKKYQNWLNDLSQTSRNFSEIYKECVIPSPCWMMHKSTLEIIGAFDADIYPEDYELAFRMYANRLQVAGVAELCHYWRDYPERSSRNDEHYADNNFLDLKITFFLKIDRDEKKPLILWGAGRKGKFLAKKLVEQQIPFKWICDNDKKIGKAIYGLVLEDSKEVRFANQQIIVAVANEAEQADIKKMLGSSQAFFFC